MDEKTAAHFLKRARIAASRFGFQHEAEDLAQDVLLAFLRNPETKQSVDQAVVDAIRQSYGRTSGSDDNGKSLRKRGTRVHVELSEAAEVPASSGPEYSGLRPLDADVLLYLGGAEKKDASFDRAIFILIYGWGFKETEVGLLFGVTESRISQRLRSLQERISKAMEAEKQRAVTPILQNLPGNSRWAEIESRSLSPSRGEERQEVAGGQDFSVAQEEPWEVENSDEASLPEWFA